MVGTARSAPLPTLRFYGNPSVAEPRDHIRERDMADTGTCSRTNVSALQRRCKDHGGVGLDASAYRGEFWPARGIGDLMEVEPSRDADENAVGQRRALTDEKGLIPIMASNLSMPLDHARGARTRAAMPAFAGSVSPSPSQPKAARTRR